MQKEIEIINKYLNRDLNTPYTVYYIDLYRHGHTLINPGINKYGIKKTRKDTE